jgi:hypothetical protein
MRARSPEEAVHLALQDADEKWRSELPKVAKKVDKLKSEPGWEPTWPGDLGRPQKLDRYQWRNCQHCGERFVALTYRKGRFCSTRCGVRHRHGLAS